MTYNVFGGTLNLAQLNSTRGSCARKVQELDWVLFYWAHFTLRRFICVYVCILFFLSTAYVLYYCKTVRWT